jgi:hypothetical protein
MPDPTPPPVPVGEGDERRARDYRALLKILLDERDLGSAVVALADFVAAVRSERDAELPRWKDRPDRDGWWLQAGRATKSRWVHLKWFGVRGLDATALSPSPYSPLDSDRWFGPIVITPDGGRKT